MEIKPQRF